MTFLYGTGQEALTQAATEALSEALDNLGDETSSNPKIAVSWSNIKNRPIAASSTNIGVKGDLFVSGNKSLKVIENNQFSRNPYGQVGMTTSASDTILNFGTKEAFTSIQQIDYKPTTKGLQKAPVCSLFVVDRLLQKNVCLGAGCSKLQRDYKGTTKHIQNALISRHKE
jgi:hypothetical protein